MKRFRAILHARNMEFVRDRGTLIWNILFPVLLVFGFAFAFRGDGNTVFSVGYLGDIPENLTFFTLDHVEYIPYEDLDDAVEKVRFHQVDFFIDTRDDTCTLASMVFAHSRECSGIQIAVEYFATTPTALCLANQLSKSFEPKARKAAVRQQKRDVRLFLFFASALFCAFSAV